MNIIKKLFPFAVILILSYFSYKPLLSPGFFPIHDDTQVARVYEMTQSLKDGMFPVRWVEDLGYGYGYPIFNYYDPFPYYIGGFIGVLGVDALLATKTVMLLAILLSGFSMFFLARQFWGNLGAILASLFYVYAPYHAVDIYIRGDLAEFWAYGFIPLAFYGLWKVYKTPKFIYIAFTGVAYSLIIISHNLTAMMVSPFLLIFVLCLIFIQRKSFKKLSLYLFSSLLLGIIVSAFYWLPAILEMQYTNVLSQIGGGADFRNHFVCLSQLWTSVWGYGGSAKGCADGVSFMIGKYHIILSFVLFTSALIFLLWKKNSKTIKKEKEKISVILFSFTGFLISAFLTLEVSKPIWEFFKPMEFFQYPWRFLIMSTFFASFISGSLLWFLYKFTTKLSPKYIWAVFTFLFITAVSLKFFTPQYILNKPASDFIDNYSLIWEVSRISDEYMPKNFIRPKTYSEIKYLSSLQNSEIKILDLQKKTQQINITLNLTRESSLILPLAYFPAWKAYVDNRQTQIIENEKGSLINIREGQHNLTLKFVETPIEFAANLTSLAGILALSLGIIYTYRKKYE